MKIEKLFSHLQSKDIRLWVEHEKLRYEALKCALTPILRNELARRKNEIVSFLCGVGIHTPSISSVPRGRDFPLSFAQQRLWFIDQLEPGIAAYNIPKALRLTGTLNVAALRQSLNAIVKRHEALRTTFQKVEGQPVQVIGPAPTFTLPVVDLGKLTRADQEDEVQRLLLQGVRRPFNLSSDLMLRASLLRLGEEEHVLLLVMHHIASDGWSMGVLFRELSSLYEAFSSGKPSHLPELPIQYADFAVWQRNWLQADVLEKPLSYWKKQLGDTPPVLNLPMDRQRPVVQTYRGARASLLLPEAMCKALNALSRQEGVTLFMTLLGAFQVLLHRYTGQEDIIVGSPIANRNLTEIEGLIGFFVNTLVLRTNLSENPGFRELLGRVREVALNAYAHQDLPFEKLVEELHPERNLSRTPLFQVMFGLQNFPGHSLEFHDMALTRLEVYNETAKFDLALFIIEEGEGLRGILEYNTDLFDSATTTRLLGHFHTLLESIVSNPDQRISDLPLLTEAERHRLLVEWNDTWTDYPRDKCVHQLFEEQAERTPEAVAVVFEDQQLTYRELNARANQLARYLRGLGVGPEVLVGICVERSLDMIVGLLGILKAGGAYVPMDPTYPSARLAFMMQDTQAPVLLTHERLMPELAEIINVQSSIVDPIVVCLDRDREAISGESEENAVAGILPDNLAYIIYTSGSTGKPKGVQIEHRALVNFLHSMLLKPRLNEEDIFLSVTTFSFDPSALEFFLPLIVGAQLVIIRAEIATDGEQLSGLIQSSGATVMQATPSTWRLLLEAGWRGNGRLKILCGGEVMSRELANQLIERGASLWNLYGPTETTLWSSVYEVEGKDGSVYIGRPISNIQIFILDKTLHLVPIGVPGELHIGGAGLSRGYVNSPELTAGKFITNPFSDEPGSRMYKTGDLARYLPDGNIEFLGRIDNQVKIRGFRIEPGEIEAVLSQHPEVKETVVTVRENRLGDKRLVAYVVPDQKQDLGNSQLRRFLKEKLPDYMVPAIFVFLDALPLTPNGKVDRRALPEPDTSASYSEKDYVAPRTPIEKILAVIWAETLGLEKVGIRDDFFDLGGHSLLSIQLVSRIEKALKIKLPLSSIFQFSTVEQLTESIDEDELFEAEIPVLKGISFHDYRRMLINVSGRKGRRLGALSLIIERRNGSPAGYPLFLIGTALLGAAKYLEKDQPIYFFPPLWFRWSDPHNFIRCISEVWTDEILAVHPEGPYFLAGFCHEGWFAYQIAQNLQRRGKEVALLVLVERYAPPDIFSRCYWGLSKNRYWRLSRNLSIHWKRLSSLSKIDRVHYITKRIKRIPERTHAKQIKADVPLSLEKIEEEQISEIISTASKNYIPEPYSGKVVIFFRKPKSTADGFFHRKAWRKIVKGDIKFYTFSGDHNNPWMDQNTQRIIGEKLNECLIGFKMD